MSSQHNLLIVDDNPASQQLLIEHLMQEGYRVFMLEDGRDAVERALQVEPSLILLDIIMPKIDGFDVCQALKADQKTRDIPLIFLTSLSTTADVERGFDYGAVDFVTKPVNEVELTARIRSHINLFETQKRFEAANQNSFDAADDQSAQFAQLIQLASQQNAQMRVLMTQLLSGADSPAPHFGAQLRQLVYADLVTLKAQIEHAEALVHDHQPHAAQLKRILADIRQHLSTSIGDFDTLSNQLQSPTEALANPQLNNLSPREVEILTRIANGESIKQIGDALSLSQSSVRTYKSRILSKLEISDITQLVKFAIRNHITTV